MSADARARYGEGLGRLTAGLRGLLEQTDAPDPAALAPSVVAEMVGAVALARAVPDPAQSSEILRRSRASLLERVGAGAAATARP